MQQAVDTGEEDKILYGDKIVTEWLNFLDIIAPRSNDVNEYVEEHPLHVLLRDVLFLTTSNRENIAPPGEQQNSQGDSNTNIRCRTMEP